MHPLVTVAVEQARLCPQKNDMARANLETVRDIYEITSGMAQGDEEAYRRFYEAYCDRLFRYLLIMARGDEEFCRDILQNAMIKIVRYMKPFEREDVFWSWLTQVVRTSFIDGLRKRAHEPRVIPLPDQDWLPISMPDDSANSNPLMLALEKSLEGLAADERSLVQAVYFEKATHKDLAAYGATTAKAVESKLSRIRQKLRKRILNLLKHEERI